MSVRVQTDEPLLTVGGYRALAPMPRQPVVGRDYEALDAEGRRFALRVVAGDDPAFAARFLAEADALAELEHENIPRIYDVGEAPEGLYLATALCDGRTLGDLIVESDGLAPLRALRLIGAVADALDAAHAAEVLHGALEPGNVIVERRPVEHPMLVNFELGLGPAEAGGRRAGQAADIYSLACLLFEALTGTPARRGQEPPRASELRPGLPPAVDEPLARGMAVDPGGRPSTAGELVSSVGRGLVIDSSAPPTPRAAVVDGTPVAPPAVAESPPVAPPAAAESPPWGEVVSAPPAKRARRWPLRRALAVTLPSAVGVTLPGALALVLVVAAGVGGWLLGRPADSSDEQGRLTAGDVALTLPTGWRPGAGSPPRWLRPDSSLAARSRGGGLLAGTVVGVLPARLASRVGTQAPGADRVRLGRLEAYRWRGLRERGSGRRLTLFATAADGGPLAVACYGSPPARAACERAASSLSAPGATSSSLREVEAWSERLGRALARLDQRRPGLRQRLRSAPTSRRQARAAARLAAANRGTARALSGGDVPKGAAEWHAAAIATLDRIASSYRSLGLAARRGNRRAFRGARRAVIRQEAALRGLLLRL